MTIEAQLKSIHEELVKLNAHFEHIGVATSDKPAAAPKAEKKAEEKSDAGAIPYDKLSAAIKGKAKTHRAAVVEVLASHGVKNAQELKPEQYAEVLGKIEAIK